MRVAIASLGNSLDAFVSPAFGRAPAIVFVDVENGQVKGFEAVENPGYMANRGAGIAAAQLVASKNPCCVVAGSFGPNAYTMLAQAGLRLYSASGKVGEVAIKAERGELPAAVQGTAGGFGRGMGRGFGRGMGGGGGFGRGRRWQW